jgi:hypothetical protein
VKKFFLSVSWVEVGETLPRKARQDRAKGDTVSRYPSWLFSSLLLLAASSTVAAEKSYTCESPEVRALVEDLGADSRCEKNAWTAFSKLPAVRTVVFDPVSRSFSFTTCEPSPSSNEDILDRRRLALATQRIRLLILPQNPADGDIQIEITEGKGTEFPATSLTGTAPAEEQKDAKDEKPTVQKPPEGSSAEDASAAVQNKKNSPASKRNVQEFSRNYRLAPDLEDKDAIAESFGENTSDSILLLTIIGDTFDTYDTEANRLWRALGNLRGNVECIDRHLGDQQQSLAVTLTNGQVWTPARDNRLCAVVAEALRRRDLIVGDGYKACSAPPVSFEDDFKGLTTRSTEASGDIASLPAFLDRIERLVDRLESINPAPLSIDERSQLVKTFRRDLDKNRKYIEELRAELAEIKKASTGALDKKSTFKMRQGSQAANLRRENYQPIDNGNMRTFKAYRIEKDGHRSELPIAQLVLRSAPVDNIRFGMGLVVSQLEDPKFKIGPVTTDSEASPTASAAADDPADTSQRIFFEDENGGRVLPVVLVHNYWLRRSPLLVPTKFERWTPTLSLGIPLAKADPLTQILLGLVWELTPGIEINLGVHYGKVNSLVDGYKVGDPLGTVDLTSIQKMTFKKDFYFGIAVNATTFRTLMDSRQESK